ncbi:MAG: RDD family protein [Deltaproteobacteria bacterium]|nr:RDD family protein [Deltaproteobacteria bacterium]
MESSPTNHEDSSPSLDPEARTQIEKETVYRPATLQERFAAFFTDTFIFLHLLAGWALLLQYLIQGNFAHPFSFQKMGLVLFGSTSTALHFLYYLFFEGVLTATPGKLFGGLSVQKKMGGTPSLFSIVIRNFLRLIDYPLIFITGVGLMELTERHQRLGDILSRTNVVREVPFEPRRINLEKTPCSGATRRALAFLLDLALLLLFFYGLLFSIPTHRSLIALILLNLVPTIFLLYLTLSEWLFQTTFGKVLLGMKVVAEDGRPAALSSLLVRNFFRLFDANPIGYLCSVLSSHKQRPGDIVAGTFVVNHRSGVRSWMAIPHMLIIALGVAYLGFMNPNSYLKKGLLIRVGPSIVNPIPLEIQRHILKGLQIEQLEFGFNEEELNQKRIYHAGEVVYLLIDISGFTVNEGMAWIQADLKVHDAHGQVILDSDNLINASLNVGKKKTARLVTRFALNPNANPGQYEAKLTLRDLLGDSTQEGSKVFSINP